MSDSRGLHPPHTWHSPEQHLLSVVSHPWYALIGDLIHEVSIVAFEVFGARGVKACPLPVTTASISSPMGKGSDSVPVEVEICGERTFLADSMQFALELVVRQQRSGAWYLMPTFRGEDPDETHLNQFLHLEAELNCDFSLVKELVDELISSLASRLLLSPLSSDIAAAAGSVKHLNVLSRGKFPVISYARATELVGAVPGAIRYVSGMPVLTRLGESEVVLQMNHPACWVVDPSAELVPFYQAARPDGSAICGDLLMAIGEVAGAGQRHTGYEECATALHDHGIDTASYQWYLEMKRIAPMVTSGFGIGVERLLASLLDQQDIRNIPLAPRLRGFPRIF
jgi:asparaginyl-tRNA synthetase